MNSYLRCYKHDKEIYRGGTRSEPKLFHIEGDRPVLCEDTLFFCESRVFSDFAMTRRGVLEQLAITPLAEELARIKKEKND